jgi:phosphatidylinositol glycan class T
MDGFKIFLSVLILLHLPSPVLTAEQHDDQYHETLNLTPLSDGRILSSFEFIVETSIAKTNDFVYFPKLLGQILVSNNVRSLSLVLTKGMWNRNIFGDAKPHFVGPPGAQLLATFWNNTSSSSDTDWIQLKGALGGLFCASLSTIKDTTTIKNTRHVFPGQYHGILQREMLCTENLVPVVKLLPCRSKAGLATFLEPSIVFAGDFTAIGLRVTSNRPGQLTLSMTTTLVLDNAKYILNHPTAQHCPYASSTTIQVHKPMWGTLTTRTQQTDTPPSTSTTTATTTATATATATNTVTNTEFNSKSISDAHAIDTDVNTTHHIVVSREPDQIQCDGECWVYDCVRNMSLDVIHQRQQNWQQLIAPGKRVDRPLDIQRSLTGTGRVKGGVVTEITNIGNEAVDIKYLDVLPWYLQLYTHTLRVTLNGNVVAQGAWRSLAFSSLRVTPTYKEGPFSTIEGPFALKPGDVFRVEIQFLLVFLQFEQFPPDANRGFDIPSAIVVVTLKDQKNTTNNKKKTAEQTIYTSGLMIEMPYPDFSMPYNVVTLTSTLMAFIGGTVLNMLSRKGVSGIRV